MGDATLINLLRQYHVAQPKRATGGLWALSGFDFQLRVFIADFAAALASGRGVEEAGAHFLEALSDFVRQAGRSVVCVQVKRTLDQQSLTAAALEFATIDEFLATHANPTVLPSEMPRYEVVGRFDGGRASWVGFALSESVRRKEPNLATRFEAIRSAGRLEAVRQELDPWWRMIASVYSALDDPFAFGREALDLCLRMGSTPDEPRLLRDRIAEAFARHRRRVPQSTTRFLVPTDFAPPPGPRPEFVVGQMPSLDLLRDDQYMARAEHVAGAVASLERLLASRAEATYQAVDTFWIDGRSGCGKSVLLLQLMQEMVRRGLHVAWLGGQSGALLDLLQSLDERPERNPDLIFVDDFYDPQGQQSARLQSVLSHVAQNPRSHWPTVVTCGPPEFHELLRRDTGGIGFNVHPWRLQPVGQGEAKALVGWFEQRTGTRAQTGPAFDQREGLIVSMALEMRHGRVELLARKFRDRLRVARLDAPLRVPLALNRLYIWTPVSWFSREQVEALDALNVDRDFSLLQTKFTGLTYVRLTHPHLSQWIYEAIRTPFTPTALANDLADAFTWALAHDTSTTRRILRVLGDGHTRLAAIDGMTLAGACAAAWNASIANAGLAMSDDALTDCWTSWACWAARDPFVKTRLGVDPLDRARQLLFAGDDLRDVLWDRLRQAYPDHAGLVVDAHNWLISQPTFASPAWPYVWQRVCPARHLLPAGTDLTPFATLGWAWLENREERPEWTFIWQRLLEWPVLPKTVTAEQILVRGHGWLSGRESRTEWSYVWRRLVDAEFLPDGVDRADLLAWGHRWLTGREERNEWSYIWRRLVDAEFLPDGVDRADLLAWGHRWLTGREDRDDWAFVWHCLVDAEFLPDGVDRADLLAWGHRWLTGREERNEWNYIWQRLLDAERLPAGVDRSALLAWGYRWLTGREERNEWNYIWQRLLDAERLPAGVDRSALLAWGYRWLTGHEERDGWSMVWEHLVDADHLPAGVDRTSLLTWGHRWLSGREEYDQWSYVWQRLCKADPTDGLFRAASLWLIRDDVQRRGEWSHIFEEVIRRGHHDARLIEAGIRWMLKHTADPQVPPLAVQVLQTVSGVQSLDELAEWLGRWLPEHQADSRAWFAYQRLRETLLTQSHSGSGWKGLADWVQSMDARTESAWTKLQDHLATGTPIKGRVERRGKKGFVVDVGMPALIPLRGIPSNTIAILDGTVGREIELRVSSLNNAQRRAFLAPMTEGAPLPQAGQTYEGVVTGHQSYGVFCEVDGVPGLLHRHELSEADQQDMYSLFPMGRRLRVQVLSADPVKRRLSLALSSA